MANKSKVFAAVVAVAFAGAAQAATCALSDVTFSPNHPEGPYVNSTACSIFSPTGPGGNIALADINNLWSGSFGSGAFSLAVKDDEAPIATGDPVLLFGGYFAFSLQALDLNATSGTYLLTATDLNGAGVTPDFPIDIDFALGLKGASDDASAYLFDDVLFDGSGGGAWSVTFTMQAGPNQITPELSNFSMFVREGTGNGGDDDDFDVSAPGTLALVGLGLFAVGALRRRRST